MIHNNNKKNNNKNNNNKNNNKYRVRINKLLAQIFDTSIFSLVRKKIVNFLEETIC